MEELCARLILERVLHYLLLFREAFSSFFQQKKCFYFNLSSHLSSHFHLSSFAQRVIDCATANNRSVLQSGFLDPFCYAVENDTLLKARQRIILDS